ncbi:MAG TPA: hypothetical protein VGN07_03645 [Steroidobacteraceae bacterium]|jgi:polyphosphate:AMP phosphotransferase
MKSKPKRLSKAEFERLLPTLRNQLLVAQSALQKQKSFGLALIVTGVPTAGRSEVVNQFLEWLDPKHIKVHALEKLRRVARTRPAMWRYWITLPARGEIAIYFMGWYEDYLPSAQRAPKKTRRHEGRVLERIRQLETMLPQDRVRVLKLHLQVSEKTAAQRLKDLRASKFTRWRVTKEDRWGVKHFDRVQEMTQRCMRATAGKGTAWHVIDGTDPQLRALVAGTILLEDLNDGLKSSGAHTGHRHRWPDSGSSAGTRFKTHQSGPSLEEKQYKLELEELQGRFALLMRRDSFAKHAAVLAFEGMDAAGKGGAIRRLTAALDARQYGVVPVSAPSPEEAAHPYLWRFWRNVPDRGEMAIFDRSWYGRVLVERVRDLTPEADWRRAYDEIREFELQLTEHKIIVQKFWLVVGKDEQLKRFQERDNDPLKRFKVDPEDWANRRFYDAYQRAAHDMIERTHTDYAPWTVIEADDKRYARLKVLRTVCEALEKGPTG